MSCPLNTLTAVSTVAQYLTTGKRKNSVAFKMKINRSSYQVEFSKIQLRRIDSIKQRRIEIRNGYILHKIFQVQHLRRYAEQYKEKIVAFIWTHQTLS